MLLSYFPGILLATTVANGLPTNPRVERRDQAQGNGVQIFPTINMTDTSGASIQAHGGDILYASGSFYWFGEDKSGETTSGHFQAVNCYRSTDFSSWDFQGPVLSPISGTNISSESIVERPKVLYNAKNDEFVMWFHSDNSSYGAAMVGVATSKTIDGNYSWKGSFKPFGTDSRDMTVWSDPETSTAYLIFASDGNADLKIASLDDNYYNVVEQLSIFKSVYWEAPGVFKIDGTFYLLYSRQDGWTPTDNYYMTSTSMSGPWSDPVLLAPEGYYAYNTQNAYDIVINGSENTLRLYYGDHWNAPNLGASTYAFYPVEVDESGRLSLAYSGGYSLDVNKGTWENLTYTTVPTSNLTVADKSNLINCTACASGQTVNVTAAESFSFKWDGDAGDKVLQLNYIYDGGKNEWKTLGVSVDGADQGAALIESTRATEPYFQAPIQVKGVKPGSMIEVVLQNASGSVVFISSVDVYDWWS